LWFLNVFGSTLLAILHLEIAKKLFAAGSAEQLNSPRGSNPGASRHFFVFFFVVTPLNSVFGLFSIISNIIHIFFLFFYCEPFTGLSII